MLSKDENDIQMSQRSPSADTMEEIPPVWRVCDTNMSNIKPSPARLVSALVWVTLILKDRSVFSPTRDPARTRSIMPVIMSRL
jgi:hypothetical protein